MTMPESGAGRGQLDRSAYGAEPELPPGQHSEPSLGERMREVKDDVVEKGKTSLREAKDRAASSLSESKNSMANQVSSFAEAFRRTGDNLRAEDRGKAADLTDSIARQVDKAADYLRRMDGREVKYDLERIARDKPGLMIGGAFALGLLGARFLKSSEERREGRERTNYGASTYREGSYATPGFSESPYGTQGAYGATGGRSGRGAAGYGEEYGSAGTGGAYGGA